MPGRTPFGTSVVKRWPSSSLNNSCWPGLAPGGQMSVRGGTMVAARRRRLGAAQLLAAAFGFSGPVPRSRCGASRGTHAAVPRAPSSVLRSPFWPAPFGRERRYLRCCLFCLAAEASAEAWTRRRPVAEVWATTQAPMRGGIAGAVASAARPLCTKRRRRRSAAQNACRRLDGLQ